MNNYVPSAGDPHCVLRIMSIMALYDTSRQGAPLACSSWLQRQRWVVHRKIYPIMLDDLKGKWLWAHNNLTMNTNSEVMLSMHAMLPQAYIIKGSAKTQCKVHHGTYLLCKSGVLRQGVGAVVQKGADGGYTGTRLLIIVLHNPCNDAPI